MEKKSQEIVFLHLSDMHISNKKDMNDDRINKIVSSLKSYKSIQIENVIIVVSGDITQSGYKSQFTNARKLMGSLIKKLNKTFGCKCTILTVPGNHDINHSSSILDVKFLKDMKYSENEIVEHKKLEAFYNFAKLNNCFKHSEMYYNIKDIDINGFKIRANLVNNAIFSTRDQYKGLLYIPSDAIDKMNEDNDADFVISIMHHAPDFYRDKIKNMMEDTIVKNSNILFHGHEHYNYSKKTSFNGASDTVIQSGGCLCNNGNWNDSSYIVGILYTNTLKYEHHKFSWNEKTEQYEHNELTVENLTDNHFDLDVTEDFCDYLYEDFNENYYVFPSIIYHSDKSTEDYRIDNFEKFKEELLQNDYSLITGNGNIGKTTLLKNLFIDFSKKYYVLYGSAEEILNKKSHKKKQNIQKLIKSLFIDIYGDHESKWQAFEQADKDKCIFIFDDYNQIDGVNLNDFLNSLSERFGKIILSDSKTINFDPTIIQNIDCIARYEIKAPVGHKRREIIRAVVKEKTSDKSDNNIDNIVKQIDFVIKTQLNLIPPEPYYIIQITENFMNNVGERKR